MEAHKFEIIIDKSGNELDENVSQSFFQFSNKWKGCLKGSDISDYKDERTKYLEEKHN